jgi:predicted 2-oxoglutarate/Fe(II)-dependent dioxygenase YbiX
MLTSPVSCEIALRQKIYAAVHDYVKEINFDWWSAWNGITRPRFNRYLPGQLMHKHCDHIHSIFDGQRKGVPVLTVLGFLRDDFTGGEFVLWDDSVIEHKAGTAIIFPANFMYPHEVKKVKSGIRDTFVSWVY